MRTIFYTASSLDGFISDPRDSLSWLLSREVDRSGPMGYDGFFEGVGALAMGATTYQWLRGQEADWPYTLPCWVFTHRTFDPPVGADIRFTTGDIDTVHSAMVAAAGSRTRWLVGGGDLVGQFADHGLLDEMWVQYAPVTLGSGAPLLPRHIEFRLEELAQNGEFVCARLAVLK